MFVSKLSYVDLHNLLASKGFKKKAGTGEIELFRLHNCLCGRSFHKKRKG